MARLPLLSLGFAGAGYDRLAVEGAVTLGGRLDGRRLPSGVYLVRLVAGGEAFTQP